MRDAEKLGDLVCRPERVLRTLRRASVAAPCRSAADCSARSVDQLKQPAGFTEIECGRVELLLVIEQVLVAGDDRLGACLAAQRKEVVVLGVSRGRLDTGGIIEHRGDHLYPFHGFSRLLGTQLLAEVGLAQRFSQLSQQLWADDYLEHQVLERLEQQPWRPVTVRVDDPRGQRIWVEDKSLQPATRR